MNTDQARAAMVARYPGEAGKTIAVPNGCDEDAVGVAPSDGPFRVMYAGSVYLDRDPRPLLDAAAAVVSDLQLAPDRFTVDFIGDSRAQYGGVPIQRLAEGAGLAGRVFVHGHQPRAHLLTMLSQAAVLVILPQDSHMAVPSKVFEYMRFPVWILALASRDSAVGALLARSGADVIEPSDVAGIAGTLRRHYFEFGAGVRPEPLGIQERFTRRYQARILFGALDRLRGGGRPATLPAMGVQ
jgi:glycosyltransferase involved in cell wall biosynthesis